MIRGVLFLLKDWNSFNLESGHENWNNSWQKKVVFAFFIKAQNIFVSVFLTCLVNLKKKNFGWVESK